MKAIIVNAIKKTLIFCILVAPCAIIAMQNSFTTIEHENLRACLATLFAKVVKDDADDYDYDFELPSTTQITKITPPTQTYSELYQQMERETSSTINLVIKKDDESFVTEVIKVTPPMHLPDTIIALPIETASTQEALPLTTANPTPCHNTRPLASITIPTIKPDGLGGYIPCSHLSAQEIQAWISTYSTNNRGSQNRLTWWVILQTVKEWQTARKLPPQQTARLPVISPEDHGQTLASIEAKALNAPEKVILWQRRQLKNQQGQNNGQKTVN